MKRIHIQIPDMLSAHCQLRVKNALEARLGVTNVETRPGVAEVSADNETTVISLTETVQEAGYRVESTEIESPDEPDEAQNRLSFKTNINCSGCVAKVAPLLDTADGIADWQVDTAGKDKTLSVKTRGRTADEVMELVRRAGFRIEPQQN